MSAESLVIFIAMSDRSVDCVINRSPMLGLQVLPDKRLFTSRRSAVTKNVRSSDERLQ
jgi:hypothetical protein